MSEQDRLRAKLAHEFAPEVAERMYQADRPSRHAKLSDLPAAARQRYIEEALNALLGPGQATRIHAAQVEIAHHHAAKDHETESYAAAARQDIKKYGNGSGSVN